MSVNQTNLTGTVLPRDWLYYDFNALDTLEHWPWSHVSVDQWKHFLQRVSYLEKYIEIQLDFDNAFIAIGLLGTLLTGVAVLGMPRNQWNSYYVIMLAEAFWEAAFLILKVTRQEMAKMKLTSTIAVAYYVFASAMVYTCSLVSDMLTLNLTIERYVALAAPVFYKKLSTPFKRRAWFVAIFISTLLACTRIHYAFVNHFYRNDYIASQSWYLAMCYTSDTVIPFVLTVAMAFLVAGILKVLWRRRKQKLVKVASKSTAGVKMAAGDNQAKMMSLLAILLVTFFLNQVGYIIYDVSVRVYEKSQQITYDSTYEEVESLMVAFEYYSVAGYFTSFLEIATRSVPFYLYMMFNARFRKGFLGLFRACGVCSGSGESLGADNTVITGAKQPDPVVTQGKSTTMGVSAIDM